MTKSPLLLCTIALLAPIYLTATLSEQEAELEWTLSHLPHHREKRFLFMTNEKRIVMPPGSQLVLTPTLAMPFIRHPPEGLDANMTISTPFTISFDAMGVTDNQNPFGLLPFLNPILGSTIFGKRKRSVPDPEIEPHTIKGGERAFLYEYVEDYLFTFGMDGKACLLRAICETHESPLIGYGFVGEMLEMFLTPTKSPYWKKMTEYIAAEQTGRKEGDCWKFAKDCSRSLFKHNKYTKEAQNENQDKKIYLEDFLQRKEIMNNNVM